MKTALVACIGNDLVADDGVGHVVYDELCGKPLPPGVRLILLGLGGMNLLHEFDGEDLLIVVDAVQFGAVAGTIHELKWSDLPASDSHVSCHGIGIREAVEVSRRLFPEKAPKEVFLVGIEGQCFDQLGEGLTPEVSANVGKASAAVLSLLQSQ